MIAASGNEGRPKSIAPLELHRNGRDLAPHPVRWGGIASSMSPRDALVKLQTRLGVPSAVKIIDALRSDRERAGLQQAQAALAELRGFAG
jgi:hypothetical protein